MFWMTLAFAAELGTGTEWQLQLTVTPLEGGSHRHESIDLTVLTGGTLGKDELELRVDAVRLGEMAAARGWGLDLVVVVQPGDTPKVRMQDGTLWLPVASFKPTERYMAGAYALSTLQTWLPDTSDGWEEEEDTFVGNVTHWLGGSRCVTRIRWRDGAQSTGAATCVGAFGDVQTVDASWVRLR